MSSPMQHNQNLKHFPMYELSGSWANECAIDRVLLRYIAKHEIHVLLVDHDKECLISTSKMLELYSYKVSRVEQASTALMMLSNGWRFDLVMANVHSPELLAFKLLDEAVKMEMLVILTSDFEDPFIARKALQHGAFLFVKKPANMELLKYLWQHVIRERKRKGKEKERVREMNENHEKNLSGLVDEVAHANSSAENQMQEIKSKGKTALIISGTPEAEDGEGESSNYTDRLGKRIWTSELHAKFVDAVKQLGDGKCFPAEILALMNVTGLTRMQVASHLQKCRRNTWRDPHERKRRSSASEQASDDDETEEKTLSKRRFGLMPYGGKNLMNVQGTLDVRVLNSRNIDVIMKREFPKSPLPNFLVQHS